MIKYIILSFLTILLIVVYKHNKFRIISHNNHKKEYLDTCMNLNDEFLNSIIVSNSEPLIVYRFYENECYICIANDRENIRKFCKEFNFPAKNFLIVPDYNKSINSIAKFKKEFPEFNIFFSKDSLLNIKNSFDLNNSDQMFNRYFSILTKHGCFQDIYFPSMNSPKKDEEYFEYLKESYNSYNFK